MLQITKGVLHSRRGELPQDKDLKYFREYFEDGCICLEAGDLKAPVNEPDDVACLYYIMWCGCSRHYNAMLRK